MTLETTNLACDTRFAKHLSCFELQLLKSEGVCAFGLWPDLKFSYLSPGWFAFAAANGGEPQISSRWNLGAEVLSGIQGPLQELFEAGYRRCLSDHRPWEHAYECSSPTQYRLFQMIAYPLELSAGLLVVHSLRIERAIDAAPNENAARESYVDGHGIYHQCSYCRRMRRADRPEIWDWVSKWVSRPPEGTSHGICEGCFGYYWPRLEAGLDFKQPFSNVDVHSK